MPGLESLPSDAQDINVYGDLTGYVVTAAGDLRAYRYTATTGVLDLIAADGHGGSYTMGVGINASGEVTGFGDTAIPRKAPASFRAAPAIAGAEAAEPGRARSSSRSASTTPGRSPARRTLPRHWRPAHDCRGRRWHRSPTSAD